MMDNYATINTNDKHMYIDSTVTPGLETSFSCRGQQTVFSKVIKYAPVYNAVLPKKKEEYIMVLLIFVTGSEKTCQITD